MVRSKHARKQQMQGCTPCNITSTPNIPQKFLEILILTKYLAKPGRLPCMMVVSYCHIAPKEKPEGERFEFFENTLFWHHNEFLELLKQKDSYVKA